MGAEATHHHHADWIEGIWKGMSINSYIPILIFLFFFVCLFVCLFVCCFRSSVSATGQRPLGRKLN